MQSPATELDPGLAAPHSAASLQVSFALYSAANRVVRLHRPLLDPMGLTYPQYLVLLTLYDRSPRTVGEIGTALGMDSGTLTPLLKRLMAAGLVTRTRDAADERRVIVGLTPGANSLRARIALIPSKIDAKCRLGEQELSALRDRLNGLGLPDTD